MQIAEFKFHNVNIEKGLQLEKFPVLGPNYKVEANLTIGAEFDHNHRRNIFRLTRMNGITEDVADRLPAVWLNEDHQLEICYRLPQNEPFCKVHDVDKGKSYRLIIQQVNDTLSFTVNDETITSIANHPFEEFKDVVLYASDPWSLAFTKTHGTLDDLVVFAVTKEPANYTFFCEHGQPLKIIENLNKNETDAARADFCQLSNDDQRKLLSCKNVTGTMISLLMTPDVNCNNSMSWGEQEDVDFFVYGGILDDLNTVCDEYCQDLQNKALLKVEEAMAANREHFDREIDGYLNATKKFSSISKLLLDAYKKWPGKDPDDFRRKMDSEFEDHFGANWKTGQFKDEINRIRDAFEEDLVSGDLNTAKANAEKKIDDHIKVSYIRDTF